MTRRLTYSAVLATGLIAFACSSDNKSTTSPDGGSGGETSTGGTTSTGGAKATGGTTSTGGAKATGGTTGTTTDGGTDGGSTEPSACLPGQTQVQCGQYLVQHVDACADCHSPTNPLTGSPDYTKALQGNPAFADIAPTDPDKGNIPTPNLTLLNSEGWTVAEIKDAFLNGKRSAAHGGGLFPIMPYANFHNMSAKDADAIAAYIFQLTPGGTAQPVRQPLPAPLQPSFFPIPPVDATKIPNTTLKATDAHYEDAVMGKYLAGEVGICIECHTGRTPAGSLDVTRFYGGGETYVIGGPFGTVTAANITQDHAGIKGWTAEDIQTLITKGKTKDGAGICPPMPAGPNGAFAKMDATQALDIGYYLTSIAPTANPDDAGAWPLCVPPGPPPPPTDAGTDAASSTDAGTGDAGDAASH